nr:hypothetical protein [Tanacetum cinerariifolium]
MDTTIDQQVEMDEALVPHARKLRIRRSTFYLLSDISSKESTLQLVYDVLRLTPFFKAFLVKHKDTKKSNEMYYPRFTKVIIHHFMSKDPSIPRRNKQTHISQASGFGTDEGTGTIPWVLDVPTDESKEEISWNSTDEEGDDDQEDERNDEDDQEEGSDDEQASDEEEFIHPSLSTHAEEEIRDEKSFDPIPKTPENTDDEGNGEENM